ncbi:hypothetical protein CDV36_015960 [Fusarium kuroshium]|uniref:Uncharacterized protein n=1 Tax=Fusarium kuroshium TaxID=2010991 RepID=A0A3M2R3E7_9HYPO|nr:hypothetical protein CDV36_015960 [Fusarium kuroshium]
MPPDLGPRCRDSSDNHPMSPEVDIENSHSNIDDTVSPLAGSFGYTSDPHSPREYVPHPTSDFYVTLWLVSPVNTSFIDHPTNTSRVVAAICSVIFFNPLLNLAIGDGTNATADPGLHPGKVPTINDS